MPQNHCHQMKKERNWKKMRLIVTFVVLLKKEHTCLLNNKCVTTGFNYYFPSCRCMFRGFIKFLCRRSVGLSSGHFQCFLWNNKSKKRRRKQLGKLMAKSRSQPVNLPSAQPWMNPLYVHLHLVDNNIFIIFNLLFLVLCRQSVRHMKLVPKRVRLR